MEWDDGRVSEKNSHTSMQVLPFVSTSVVFELASIAMKIKVTAGGVASGKAAIPLRAKSF